MQPAAATLAKGTHFADRYEIEGELGSGSFSRVYFRFHANGERNTIGGVPSGRNSLPASSGPRCAIAEFIRSRRSRSKSPAKPAIPPHDGESVLFGGRWLSISPGARCLRRGTGP